MLNLWCRFLKITAVKSIADSQRLQTDLNSLARWADDWLLRFNVKKCNCMSIGSTTTTSYNLTDASNNQHNLSTTDCEKDLGIWLSSTLYPSVQCQKAYSKAIQSLLPSNDPSSILLRIYSIFYTKPIFDHTLNTVSKHGVHITQKTLIC